MRQDFKPPKKFRKETDTLSRKELEEIQWNSFLEIVLKLAAKKKYTKLEEFYGITVK